VIGAPLILKQIIKQTLDEPVAAAADWTPVVTYGTSLWDLCNSGFIGSGNWEWVATESLYTHHHHHVCLIKTMTKRIITVKKTLYNVVSD